MNGPRGAGRSRRSPVLRRELPLLVALVLLVVALTLSPVELPRPVHHYQVTLDVSQSMAVRDVVLDGEPASRLDLARAAAAELLLALPCGSRVGWSAFVERRSIVLVTPIEVCAHYDALLASLAGIDARLRWGEASGIGKGLHQALRAADAIGGGEGDEPTASSTRAAAVMISDGQEAPPLGPGQSGYPKDEGLGVRGLLAGVGGDEAVPIPKLDAAGQVVGYWTAEEVVQRDDVPAGQSHEELSRLDEAHLADLARLASLEYARLEKPGDLAAALRRYRLGGEALAPTDLRWLPAAFALALLGWRFRPVAGQSRTGRGGERRWPER